MRLTDVRLERIKSYDDKTTVGLGEGVTAILGENGAGKSTVAEAVGWALFDSLPYTHDEFVREGESSGTVWVTFELDGRTYTVQRGTSGTYAVVDETADAELELGSKGEVIDWLETQFDLDEDGDVDLSTLWERCLGVAQTQFLSDFRASKGTREDKFDPLLGIDIYEQAWSSQSTHNLKQPVDELKSRKQTAKERISRLEGIVEDLPEQREAVHEQEQTVENLGDKLAEVRSELAEAREAFAELDELKQHRDDLKQTIDSAEKQIEGKTEQLDTARSDLQDAREAARIVDETADAHQRFRKADERLSELHERDAERDELEDEIEDALENYRQAKQAYEKLRDQAEAAQQAKDRMAELETAYERYEALDEEIEEAQNAAERIKEIDKRISEIEDTDLPEAEEEVTKQCDHISDLQDKQAIAEAVPDLNSMRADLEATIEAQQAEIEELEEQRDRLLAVTFDDQESDGGASSHDHGDGATCPTCDRPLDTDTRDNIVETIEAQIADAEAEIAAAEARLPAVRTGLEAAKEAQKAVAGLDAAKDRLKELEEAVDDLKTERKKLDDERGELEPLADQLADLQAEQDELEDDHEDYERAQFEYDNKQDAIDQVEEAREELYRTAREAAKLERQLATEFGDLDERMAEQRTIRDETEDAHNRYVRNETEAERVPDRREQVIELYQTIEAAERTRRAAESELTQVKADFDADRHDDLDNRVDRLNSRETEVDTKLNTAKETLADQRSELQRLETVAEQLDRWKETHVQLERDIHFAETVRDGVRDAGPKMRELIAGRIGERANQIYQTLRGTGRESLTWDETYRIIVQDGSQRKPFGNLSGGEKMAAALAVRLAIMERVSPIDMAFLDEPTANLDSEKKNNLVRQLERLDAFEQLCVISHDDTFESMTEYTVTLEKPDRETFVTSDAHADAGGSTTPEPEVGDD
jgi:exonuclease SbcC